MYHPSPFEPASSAPLTKIGAFARHMLEARSLDDLLWGIAQQAGETLGFEDCVVYLRDEDVLVQMAAFGLKSTAEREIFQRISIPVGQGIVGTVAGTGRRERVGDISRDPRYIPDQFPGRSELAVPLRFEGRVLGVLDTESSRADAYSAADADMF